MRALSVTIFAVLIAYLSSSPMPAKICNPCSPLVPGGARRRPSSSLPKGRLDYKITKNKIANGLANLYGELNLTYYSESKNLHLPRETVQHTNCRTPTTVDISNWIVCAYNTIAAALKNITETERYGDTDSRSIANIITLTRTVLCSFRSAIIQTEDNHELFQRNLSENACAISGHQRQTTPGPNEKFEFIESLKIARDVVQSVNETLVKNVPGRLLLYRSRRNGNKKRRKNKCKKLRNRKDKRKCKRRNKNRRKNRKNRNKRKNREKFNRRENRENRKRKYKTLDK